MRAEQALSQLEQISNAEDVAVARGQLIRRETAALRVEIERMQAALTEIVDLNDGEDWALFGKAQTIAREALGANEQSTRLFNTWECTNCGQFHPFTMSLCPTAGER